MNWKTELHEIRDRGLQQGNYLITSPNHLWKVAENFSQSDRSDEPNYESGASRKEIWKYNVLWELLETYHLQMAISKRKAKSYFTARDSNFSFFPPVEIKQNNNRK